MHFPPNVVSWLRQGKLENKPENWCASSSPIGSCALRVCGCSCVAPHAAPHSHGLPALLLTMRASPNVAGIRRVRIWQRSLALLW